MKIKYMPFPDYPERSEIIDVEFVNSDDDDLEMSLCVRFPKGHEMHDPDGVWLWYEDFEVISE